MAGKKRKCGQSGPPLILPFDRLGEDERRVVTAFLISYNNLAPLDSAPLCIEAIADLCFPHPQALSHPELLAELRPLPGGPLRVRNALRRLVRGGWVDRVSRGRYGVGQALVTQFSPPAASHNAL